MIPKHLLDDFKNGDCHYYFNDLKVYNNSKECNETWDKINSMTTEVLNWYDLFRKVYPDDDIILKSENRHKSVNINGEEKKYKSGFTFKDYTPWAKHIPENAKHPLLGSYMTEYVNRYDVRKALNIPDYIPAWSQCNNPFQDYYHYQYEGSQWIYKVLKPYGYKMLFFSGDTDGAVPTFGTRQWISQMDYKVKEEWKPWITDGQVSGYIVRYDGLDFATVHGVGHMAP